MFSHARFHQGLWTAAVAVAAAALLVSVARPRAAAKGAMADASTPSSAPYRGFTTPKLDPAVLSDAATKWHADIVRYIMRPQFVARNFCHCSNAEAWDQMVRALPAQLDAAKQLHMTVVLAMFQPPVENFPAGKDREGLAAFWANDQNLQVMTKAWIQIAKICADRDQVIWFDLQNEPVNFQGPSSPKNWPVWAQSLINSIRQIDQRHQIVIEGFNGASPAGFQNFPRLEGDGLIYSFHDYSPSAYTMQGIAGFENPTLAQSALQNQLHWPGNYPGGYWDKHRLENTFQPVVDFQKRYGARIYVGEFSVARWAPDAPRWLEDNIDIFEKHGWDWTYHGFRESNIWSVEYSDDQQNAKNLQNTGQLTDRGEVLQKYFSRNATQQ